MPIPVSDRKAWAVVFAEQFTSTAPPPLLRDEHL